MKSLRQITGVVEAPVEAAEVNQSLISGWYTSSMINVILGLPMRCDSGYIACSQITAYLPPQLEKALCVQTSQIRMSTLLKRRCSQHQSVSSLGPVKWPQNFPRDLRAEFRCRIDTNQTVPVNFQPLA